MPTKSREQKHRSIVRRALRTEIESVKEKVRAAYILETKREEGQELTQEERKIIEERPVNIKLNEALHDMYMTQSSPSVERNRGLQEEEIWTLMHFFYLVRLAQQGFFYLISNMCPSIEPQALTFLADKMVGSSLYASRSPHEQSRKSHKAQVRRIVRDLHAELDEPIAEGFRTTYQQIMRLIHGLVDQSLGEQDSKEKEGKEKQPQKPVGPTIPPVWVVMPYSSMMDGATFAMPGAIPTLPYPSTLLPAGALGANAFPFMSSLEENKKRLGHTKRKSKKQKEVEEEEEQVNKEEQVSENEPSVQDIKETQDQIHHEQFEDDGEDERFADPETSDEEARDQDEDEEEDDEEEEDDTEKQEEEHQRFTQEINAKNQQEQTSEGWGAIDTKEVTQNGWGEETQKKWNEEPQNKREETQHRWRDTEQQAEADKKWQSFASRKDNDSSTSSRANSPRNSSRNQNQRRKFKSNRY
ncbi:uncharacterized protein B0P05DRAFT_535820 [Gilbertella persicaria]|uniref:uncharacterized protein n=1 Tax=Gilbertella persicaria TaxID=101096 RepID=UPI0022205828|nr:uncharacterized protein B0P05DRAFT_535820 [Gilbertella persicaria]KAI8084005.1 hypothetical protein B0P05DRAFT_535820 [Gilbertella persicaria]